MENTFASDAFKEYVKACQNTLMSNSEISKSLEQFAEAMKSVEFPVLSNSIESIRKAILDMNVSTPNSVRAAAEALQAMCDYVSPQNRNADKLSAPEAPAKRKQNFFDKLEAVAEKYKCSLNLLVSILIPVVIAVIQASSSSPHDEQEIQMISEIRDAVVASSDSQSELQDILSELQSSIEAGIELTNAVPDVLDQAEDAAEQAVEPADVSPQPDQTDEDNQQTDIDEKSVPSDDLQ